MACEYQTKYIFNKLSFDGDKTKSIIFESKRRSTNFSQVNIIYNHINIKQISQAIYLGSTLDDIMPGEPMPLKVMRIINEKLKFLYKKNRYLKKNFEEWSDMLLLSHILAKCDKPGTLLSMQKWKRKQR